MLERRNKETLTAQDVADAKAFSKKPNKMLKSEGRMLKAEAIAQVDYISTMARLDKQLLHKTYKLHAGGASPGMSVAFNKADELCRQNPTFQSSLVVSLLKAAVAKATSPKGSNAKTDVQVFNFIRLIATYDKKASQVVSANLGGPGDRWVRKINAKERKDCIIESGENNEKVGQRMEAAIKRRKKEGATVAFHLAIDATKIAKVLEVSHAHGSIMENYMLGWMSNASVLLQGSLLMKPGGLLH